MKTPTWLLSGYLFAAATGAVPGRAQPNFDVSTDPYQINNLADNPMCAEVLAKMRGLLARWTEETGDTVPPFERMTPARNDRKTGESIQRKGRPGGGEFPDQRAEAWKINRTGPIRAEARVK